MTERPRDYINGCVHGILVNEPCAECDDAFVERARRDAQATMRTATVPYVAGRKGALATALARAACIIRTGVDGVPFDDCSEADRADMVEAAHGLIDEWVGAGTLVEFVSAYKEKG